MSFYNTVANRDPMVWGEEGNLFDSVAYALRQARNVRAMLAEAVIPAISPARRSFADWLVQTLDHGKFFDEPALRDIDAFISLLQREIDQGTYIGWEADEYHVRGGYELIELDARARSLAPALDELCKLRSSIATALDVARARSVMQDMVSE
jgi:hypothetical protein